jgi:tetratricopeptide (TPR) repeat protein
MSISTIIPARLLLTTGLFWSLSANAIALPDNPDSRNIAHPLEGKVENDFVPHSIFSSEKSYSTYSTSDLPVAELEKTAQSMLTEHKLEQAKQALVAITAKSLDNQKAFADLGEVALKTGKPEDALPFLCIAHNLNIKDEKCLAEISLAEILIKSRHPSYHVADYFRAQSDVRSIVNEGVRLWGTGCAEQAAYLFKYATSIDPNNINAYFDLGVISEWKGDLPQAASYYDKASSLLHALKPSVAQPAKQGGLFAHAVTTDQVMNLSGAEDSSDLAADIAKAQNDVREKMAGTAKLASNPAFSLTAKSDIDTCDRCRIVRDKIMGPN